MSTPPCAFAFPSAFRPLLALALAFPLLAACQSGTDGDAGAALGYAPIVKHPLLGKFEHQTDRVRTSCFPPELELLIARVAETFDATPVVTSGFRPPQSARERRGDGSMHAVCKAADIQVPGASPSDVFRVVKKLAGRGGVGAYCHTRSVHVDVGERREWRWSC